MIDLAELHRYALVYMNDEAERVHSGSVRLLLPDVAVIHEVPTGIPTGSIHSDCCNVPVIVPFASIREINIFPSSEALETAMDDNDIVPISSKRADPRGPEVR